MEPKVSPQEMQIYLGLAGPKSLQTFPYQQGWNGNSSASEFSRVTGMVLSLE